MEGQDRYTITYRANETHQVMEWIKARQCGCIVGLRGSGKSIFLHFLFREDVCQYYLGQGHANYAFILLDLLSLIENTEWAVYELILSRLIGQLRRSGVEDAVIEEMVLLHQEFTRSRESRVAHRTIERCLDSLCSQPEQQVVLFFDEFDPVFRTADPSLFRFLRGLWNKYNGQLSYIVAVANELTDLREDLVEIDHFYRLVSRNVCGLGPLCEADAREMIDHLAARRTLDLSKTVKLRLIELTGEHGGLLKTLLSLLWGMDYEGDLAKLELAINDEPQIERECAKIWSGLSKNEQTSLSSLVNGETVNPPVIRRLTTRGLLRKTDPPVVFSPLFTAFVRKQAPSSERGTYINRSPRLVQLDGQRIETLTEMEFEVLCYLYEQRGRVCTKYDLIENVYRQRYNELQGGVTDDSIQALISRLREKIEPDRNRPRYVTTIRGEGYRFVETEES